MKNSIRVSLTYSYRGETFTPSVVIDLDSLQQGDGMVDWHARIALANGIDTYSYVYEVARASELHFSEPTGLAEAYLQDGDFDFEGYLHAARQSVHAGPLQNIARDLLGIEDLNSEPAIRDALVQAYLLGRNTPRD